MSDAYYDVVVVGTELPGLISGAMLAKKGYRVLVIGHGHKTNSFAYEGYQFVRRPWLFSGFETSVPIKTVFAELSLSLEMHNRPKPFDPFYQVVMPGRRLNVVSKETVFERELKREFPGQVEKIQSFYHVVRRQNDILSGILEAPMVMPPQGFMEQRAFKKLVGDVVETTEDPLSSFHQHHPFRPFILAPLMFGSGCHQKPYSPIQLIRAVTHFGRGLYQIEGGIDALKGIFVDKVRDNCGDYREKSQVDRFVMRRGKVKELVIRDRREVIGCDAVVCNTDVKRFFNLIPEEAQKQRFHLTLLELQPTHMLYTTNFALRREAIPQGMGRHAFLVHDPAKPLEGDNLILCCLDPAHQAPEPDSVVLSATMRLPMRSVRPTLDSVESHDQRIMKRLRDIVPFFDEHLLARASAWVSYQKRTNKPYIDTAQLVPSYGRPLPDTLEATPIACRTAYKNVLITGDHIHAGLGFEGAFLGSLNAVQLTMEMVARKSLLN